MAEVDAIDPALAVAIRSACRAAGLDAVRIEPLAGGLSLRRFARVHTGSRPASLIARVEAAEDPAGRPAGAAPEPPHEPIRALLERHGLPVPGRLGGDETAGVELLEDLGDLDLTAAARGADRQRRRSLYREACQLVPKFQRIEPVAGVDAFERRLDAELIAYKAELFASDGLGARGRAATPAETRCVSDSFARIAAELAPAPVRLAHRDFQSANLLVTGAGAGASLHPIDLQGAFLAPPEYDLVCLLCDSYVELPEAEIRELADEVRPALPDAPEPGEFWRRFDRLTLTRKGKDYARFVYAARTRGDRRFLAALPTTLGHLRRAAREAAARDAWLAPLAELVESLPESL